jgi:hypothetical protein
VRAGLRQQGLVAVRGEPQRPAEVQRRAQQRLAGALRQPGGVLPVHGQQVEQVVEDGDRARGHRARVGQPHPLLEQREVGAAGLHRDDLAVHREVPALLPGQRGDHLGVGGLDPVAGTGQQVRGVALAHRQRPDAVQLPLEQPALVEGAAVGEGGQHRRHRVGGPVGRRRAQPGPLLGGQTVQRPVPAHRSSPPVAPLSDRTGPPAAAPVGTRPAPDRPRPAAVR